MDSKPRILLLDIETLPSTVYTWGAKAPPWISASMLAEEAHMACAAWKWLDEPKVYVSRMRRREGELPDMPIIRSLARAWDKADAIVAQNGDKFDLRWIKARMLKAGMPPPKPVVQIDTLKIIRKNFSEFAVFSASLGYVAQFLGLGEKIKTDFDLWKGVMAGDRDAMDAMVKYNVHDVRLLEKVYKRIAPYAATQLNQALFTPGVCPLCGEKALEKRGYAYSKARVQQRFVCMDCGKWSQAPLPKPQPKVAR